MSEGCLEARGEVGAPRMCSAKLERCDESGLGLEPILSAGGGERPNEDTELLSDCIGETPAEELFFSCAISTLSAMAARSATVGAGWDAGECACSPDY